MSVYGSGTYGSSVYGATVSPTAVSEITLDSSSSADGTSSPLTWSHTVGNGNRRILVVGVSIRKESDPRPTVTAVTFGGVALTQAVTRANDGKTSSDIWYLVSPAISTDTISVTTSSAPTNIVGGATSWFGIDIFSPIGVTATAAGEDAAATLNIAALSGMMAISCVSSVAPLTVNSPQTEAWADNNSFLRGSGGYLAGSTDGTVTLGWTVDSVQKWTIAAIALVPFVAVEVYPETAIDSDMITMTPELWIATSGGFRHTDITEYLIDGMIDMSVDRSIKMSCQIRVRNPGIIEPFSDYLMPIIRYEYADGRPDVESPLGLYAIRVPTGEYTVERSVATFNGYDMTSLAFESGEADSFSIPAGFNPTSYIQGLLVDSGIIRKSIPSTSDTFAQAFSRSPGTPRGEIVNDILNQLGWYTMHADLTGRVTTTGEYRDLHLLESFATYADADLRTPFTITPSEQQICNVAIVVNENYAAAPLVGTHRNDDAASPSSTVSLGREIICGGRPFVITGETTQAALNRKARQMINEGRSYYRAGTFSVLPNPDGLIPHQTVALNLTGEMEDLSGLWWIRGAKMGLTPQTCLLTLDVAQTIRFDGTVL